MRKIFLKKLSSQEDSISILERRSNTHYVVNQPALIKIKNNNIWENINIELVDISIAGAKIYSKIVLESLDNVILEINTHDLPNKTLHLNGGLEPTIKNKFFYTVRFSRLQETEIKHLNLFLERLNTIPDRRTQERRQRETSHKWERRKFERRIIKPFFLKCLRYNRMEKLMDKNQYFYLREFEAGPYNITKIKGKETILLGSNNYLGLTYHPRVKEATINAIEKYGTGACGSRIINGNFDLHGRLEQLIAKHKRTEDCIVYSTGYMANLGGISTLLDKNSIAIIDEKCHASIIDGCSLTKALVDTYNHNDMESLEKELKKTSGCMDKIIITEGVFSMDGETAKLDEILQLAYKYATPILVDDAHGTGVLGEHGRGTLEHYGVEGKVDLVMGTFSKTLGGIGGFIAANRKIIHYLKHNSRSFLFTAGLPPAVCAAVIAAFEVIEAEPELRQKLWRNINFLKENLLKLGYHIGETNSAIIPIIIGDEIKTYQLVGLLEKLNVFVNPIAYPAVRKRESRIRISVMATHTFDNLEKAIEAFKIAGKQIGLI